MASRHSLGALQPDGRIIPEATFDPKHVANAIVHIAGLPNDVAVLEMNIMRVLHSSFVVVVDIDVHWRIEFRASQAPFIGRG
jgi:hypothetical protein